MKELLVNGGIPILVTTIGALVAYLLYKSKTKAEIRKTEADANYTDANSYDKYATTITKLLDDVQSLTVDNVRFERAIRDCEQREIDLKTQVNRAESTLKSEMSRLKAEVAALDAKVGSMEQPQ